MVNQTINKENTTEQRNQKLSLIWLHKKLMYTMQQSILEINSVHTSVITYGRWVEETPKTKEPEDIILIIPGNPGAIEFYKIFMQILYEKTGYSVWIVGYAGVLEKVDICNIKPVKGNAHLFGLEAQIEHKKRFIERYIPKNARIHLIGHSMGAYMILKLLKEESINSLVIDVIFLFPAIENLTGSKRFNYLIKVFKPISWLMLFSSWLYVISPSHFVQRLMRNIVMRIGEIPEVHSEHVHHFINYNNVEKLAFFIFEEVPKIEERDDETIKANINKIKFIYGELDKWAPAASCHKLKNEIPGVDAEVVKFEHSFVIRQSREVGHFVASLLVPHMPTRNVA